MIFALLAALPIENQNRRRVAQAARLHRSMAQETRMSLSNPVKTAIDHLPKPAGKQLTYVFNTGERLHIFNVQEQNLSGAWYRITDGDGHLYVIDPAKVLYIVSKQVA